MVVVVFYLQVETGVIEYRFQLSTLHIYTHRYLSRRFSHHCKCSIPMGIRIKILTLPRTVPSTRPLNSSQLTRALSLCRVDAVQPCNSFADINWISDFAVPWQRSRHARHNIDVISLRGVARCTSSSQRLVQKLLLCKRHPPEDAHEKAT